MQRGDMRAARSVRTFPGKDAGLISSSKSNLDARRAAPRALRSQSLRSRCAPLRRSLPRRGLQRVAILHFAICILQFATCNRNRQPRRPPSRACPPVDPPPSKRPSFRPRRSRRRKPCPRRGPTAPPRASFRSVQIFPRAEGLGPRLEIVPTPAGENVRRRQRRRQRRRPRTLASTACPHAFGPLGDIDIETDRAVIWGIDVSGSLDRRHAARRHAAGNLHGRQHRLPPGRPHRLRRPHVLRRPPPGRHHPQRRAAHARAASRATISTQASCGSARPPSGSSISSHFVAQNGLVTTSRLEEPSYAFAADTITFEDIQQPVVDPLTGAPAIDPSPASPSSTTSSLAESQNNFLYVGGVPVFYWPTLATDLREAELLHQQRPHPQRLGLRLPGAVRARRLPALRHRAGRTASKWDLNLDYLSERGFGFGTGVEYARDSFFDARRPHHRPRSTPGSSTTTASTTSASTAATSCPKRRSAAARSGTIASTSSAACSTTGPCRPRSAGSATARSSKQYYENEWDENKDQTHRRAAQAHLRQPIDLARSQRPHQRLLHADPVAAAARPLLARRAAHRRPAHVVRALAGRVRRTSASPPRPPTRRCSSQFELLPVGRRRRRQPDHRPGRAVRHAAGDRLADRPRAVQGRAVRARRARPLGPGHQRRRHPAGLRPRRRAGQHPVLVRRSHDPRRALQPQRPRAQSRVRRRSLLRRRQRRTSTSFPLYDELDDDSIEEFRRRLFFSPFGGESAAGLYYIPGAAVVHRPEVRPAVRTPSAPACRTGSRRRRPKSPTT